MGALGDVWRPLGGRRGRFWRRLEGDLGCLWRSWRRLGDVLEGVRRLGGDHRRLGIPGGIWEASWAFLKASGGLLGTSWVVLKASSRRLGRSWRRLETS